MVGAQRSIAQLGAALCGGGGAQRVAQRHVANKLLIYGRAGLRCLGQGGLAAMLLLKLLQKRGEEGGRERVWVGVMVGGVGSEGLSRATP